MKKFSVIIPTYNEGDWLQKTVLSVLKQTDYPEFDIVVVSDGGNDDSADFLKKKVFSQVELIELPESVGAPHARNIGAAAATGEYFVFIDSHMIPEPNWLQELAAQLEMPNIGAATLKIPDVNDPENVGVVYALGDFTLNPTWGVPREDISVQLTPLIPGGCCAITREIWEEIGGFDPGLCRWGREDVELSLKIWARGYDLSTSQNSAIAHYFKEDCNFEISWDEVIYNIARIILCFFDDEWRDHFFGEIQIDFAAELDSALKKLSEDSEFLEYQKIQKESLSRDINKYLTEFSEYHSWIT